MDFRSWESEVRGKERVWKESAPRLRQSAASKRRGESDRQSRLRTPSHGPGVPRSRAGTGIWGVSQGRHHGTQEPLKASRRMAGTSSSAPQAFGKRDGCPSLPKAPVGLYHRAGAVTSRPAWFTRCSPLLALNPVSLGERSPPGVPAGSTTLCPPGTGTGTGQCLAPALANACHAGPRLRWD